jgi:hypothetical protein
MLSKPKKGGDVMRKLIVLLAAVVVLVGATSVYAIPTVWLRDPVSNTIVTVADESAQDILLGIPGAVAYAGPVGPVWFINVTTGITKPAQGTAISAYMDLNSDNSSNAAGTIYVWFTETDFTAPSGTFGGSFNVGGTIAAGAGNNALFGWYLDRANQQLALNSSSDLLALSGQLGWNGGAFAWSGSGSASGLTDPFSLALGANIFHPAGRGTSSFDQELTQVPEPGILILLGIGLGAVGVFSRRIKF